MVIHKFFQNGPIQALTVGIHFWGLGVGMPMGYRKLFQKRVTGRVSLFQDWGTDPAAAGSPRRCQPANSAVCNDEGLSTWGLTLSARPVDTAFSTCTGFACSPQRHPALRVDHVVPKNKELDIGIVWCHDSCPIVEHNPQRDKDLVCRSL